MPCRRLRQKRLDRPVAIQLAHTHLVGLVHAHDREILGQRHEARPLRCGLGNQQVAIDLNVAGNEQGILDGAVRSVAQRYAACDATQLGAMGCPPNGGACNQGLAENDAGLCDDDDPATPRAVQLEDPELVGLDVRDQFCRSYFCDDRFVCDPGSNNCVLCDPDELYGEGGCGQVWIAGARSWSRWRSRARVRSSPRGTRS